MGYTSKFPHRSVNHIRSLIINQNIQNRKQFYTVVSPLRLTIFELNEMEGELRE